MATLEMQAQQPLQEIPPLLEGDMPAKDVQEYPSFRRASPSPSTSPTPAIGACPELSRCVSTASSVSNFSGRSSSIGRDSLGSVTSRHSSGSYTSRQSMGGLERPKRRGYVRPQGTNFAASAQSRESVLSLGSIAHLQYYFARTGLLDGKGGRLSKKKNALAELDLTALNTNFLSPSDRDSSYSSAHGSPDLHATNGGGMLVESPIEEESYDSFYTSEDEHPEMLPPTVSTYNYKPKPIERPPTLDELKSDLQNTLSEASKVLEEAKSSQTSAPPSPNPSRRRSESDAASLPSSPASTAASQNQGWYELQGMHILDVVTLAIRAAKMYYTAHDQPARLSAIKSERKIRAELLSVMEVLKRMATRNFTGGMKEEERETMGSWIQGVYDMLKREEEMEDAERSERSGWSWLDDSLWTGENVSVEREYAFLKSMDPDSSTLPEYALSDFSVSPPAPSELLKSLQNGLKLVKLHNAIVKKSKRPFGAIPTFHDDTAKPYRCADNLRFWIKAAELRWETVLKVDVMGVVNGIEGDAWKAFEEAIFKWAAAMRKEISMELS
jgi:hypothetical protein